MPPSPCHPGDIVRVVASVDRTLRTFFYHNSHISAMPGTKSTALGRDQFKGGPVRPGVLLDLSPDSATVAMFTTLQGRGISQVKGALRPVMAAVLPVNQKRGPKASGQLPTLAIHPTWRNPPAANSTLCLCLRHRVPIDKLEPWSWKDEPVMAGERFRMCPDDLRLLMQLCEKNEGLRGLFASESWLFEEFSLVDFMKRRD